MIDLSTQELILKGDSYQVMQVLQEMLFQNRQKNMDGHHV